MHVSNLVLKTGGFVHRRLCKSTHCRWA